MSDFFIADCKPFSYQSADSSASIDLMGALENWDDDLEEQVAEHRLLKRDGALQEPMGSAAGKFSFSCIYYGGQILEPGDTRTAYVRYRQTADFFRSNKRGTLIHPQFGQIPVVFLGIRQQSAPGREGDAVVFTLRFAEDGLSDGAPAPSPGAVATAATGGATAVQASIQTAASGGISAVQSGTQARARAAALRAKFATALTVAGTLYTQTYNFASTALAAYNAVKNDPSLLGILGAVIGSAESVVGELHAAGLVGVDLYPAASAARTTVAASTDLYYLVKNRGPGTQPYPVPGATTLQALCARLYGAKNARAAAQQVLLLNPGLRFTDGSIAAGTKLVIPTVPQ